MYQTCIWQEFIGIMVAKMAEFISSFTTGFQKVVYNNLPLQVRGVKIIDIYDGLVYYSFNGNSRELAKIPYFNNTFFVLKMLKSPNLKFQDLIAAVANDTKYYLINKGTCRIRFVRENQFTHVDGKILNRAEQIVLNNSKLKINRLNPTTEIWYSLRREGFGFCGQLISKRAATEKNLAKGELRPEVAYLVCCMADIGATDVVMDPFCGHGALPVQIATGFRFSKLVASDIDKELVKLVAGRKPLANNENINVFVQDGLVLDKIPDSSVDVIITDPPWGFYEKIDDITDFYKKMFSAMRRVLKPDGRLVILSARKAELESAAKTEKFVIDDVVNTLVNGKKASVYKFSIN